MKKYVYCANRAFISLVFLFLTGNAVYALPPDTHVWNPVISNDWTVSANWTPLGFPALPFHQARFDTKGTTPDPVLNYWIGRYGDGLGQLLFSDAGWTIGAINNAAITFSNAGGDNAIYSYGSGTNTILPRIAFFTSSQSVYTGSGNILVISEIWNNNSFIVNSTNPTNTDTGAIKLTGSNSMSQAVLVRQGTLLSANNYALGGSSGTIYLGDSSSTDGAYAKLLTDGASIVSKNIEVTNISGHVVNGIIGGNQTSGASQFTGTITLNRTASLNAEGSSTVSFTNTITGNGGIRKTGAGTVVINGTNSYMGGTIVEGGTLLYNSIYSGTAPCMVTHDGVLGGTGSISTGNITIMSGGTLSPGTPGVFDSLDLGGNVTLNGTLKIEFAANPTTGLIEWDLLNSSGGFLKIASSGILDFDISCALNQGAYVFANYSILIGQFMNVLDLPNGCYIDYNYMNNNQIALVVPEPVTMLLLTIGVFGLRRSCK